MRPHTVGLVLMLAFALSIVVAPLAVKAQPPTPVPRIGYLKRGDDDPHRDGD